MRFGIFLAPFHSVRENPGLCLQRDFELVELLDQLGYDEAWIGEHHSAGVEIIASPEVFIAGVAERTRNIKLGTGVSSLPYHHPLILADRINQLDHQTRGRVMLGCGPGSLPSDAFMMGIDPLEQRRMMDEAIEAIAALLRGQTVTMKTDWFELKDARLQLSSYTKPNVEISVASTISPAGARAAGKHDLGLLAIGATTKGGFNALAENWNVWSEKAAEHGNTAERDRWRLVGPMHIAETREKARENVRYGIGDWLWYFQEVAALPLAPPGDADAAVDALIEAGFAVIGTPDDAIEQLERLEEQSGGFGTFLTMATNWADWAETKRSYELMARYVMPRFQGTNIARQASTDWAQTNRPQFTGALQQAIVKAAEEHEEEKRDKGRAAS